MRLPVGFQMLGRVVNAIGQPIDSQAAIPFEETIELEFRIAGSAHPSPHSRAAS